MDKYAEAVYYVFVKHCRSVDTVNKISLQNDWETEKFINYKHLLKDFEVAHSLSEQTRLHAEGDILLPERKHHTLVYAGDAIFN